MGIGTDRSVDSTGTSPADTRGWASAISDRYRVQVIPSQEEFEVSIVLSREWRCTARKSFGLRTGEIAASNPALGRFESLRGIEISDDGRTLVPGHRR